MVISSLVIETLRDYTQQVTEELPKIEGVEVHEINDYKIVVTIEADTVDDSYAIASGFINITGVIGINLIYCNFEEDPTIN